MADFKIRDKSTGEVFTVREKGSVDLGTIPSKPVDKLKDYKNENIGDVANNIFVRPGAAVRSAIQGKGFQSGFADPNSTKTFQQLALENASPNTSSTLLNFLGGIPASTLGLAADIATNPADLLGMLIGKAPVGGTGTTLGGIIGTSKAGQATGKFMEANRSAKLLGREVSPGSVTRLDSAKAGLAAREKVSQVLPTADLGKDILNSRASGVQAEGANLIKKTNRPQDIYNKFDNEKQRVLSQVDELVTANNKPVNPEVIKSRAKLLLQKDMLNETPEGRAALMRAYKNQVKWIEENPALDTVQANARKRWLYGETPNTQAKQMKGAPIQTDPDAKKVMDKFAQAYKEAVESAHPDIAKLNSRFSGLEEGRKSAAKLIESMVEQQPKNFVQRAVGYVAGRMTPGQGAAAAVREVPSLLQGQSKTLGKMTGQIEKLSNKSADLLNKSRLEQSGDLLDKFMSNTDYFLKKFGPYEINALTTIEGQGAKVTGKGFTMAEGKSPIPAVKSNPDLVDIVYQDKPKQKLLSGGLAKETQALPDKPKQGLLPAPPRGFTMKDNTPNKEYVAERITQEFSKARAETRVKTKKLKYVYGEGWK
jgi:hypothetical protein